MSALARANGWRGFDGIGQTTAGVTEYHCEAAGYPGACEGSTTRTKPWTTVGKKQGGWLVCFGVNDDGTDDTDVVLVLCRIHATQTSRGAQ